MIGKIPVIRVFLLRQRVRRLSRAIDKAEMARALHDVADIAARDPAIASVLKTFKARTGDLRELYHFLMRSGADCRIHGAYVAAVSITNPVIVYAYLRDRHRRDQRSFALSFVDTCFRHIEGGHTESFLTGMLKVPAGGGAPFLTLK